MQIKYLRFLAQKFDLHQLGVPTLHYETLDILLGSFLSIMSMPSLNWNDNSGKCSNKIRNWVQIKFMSQ